MNTRTAAFIWITTVSILLSSIACIPAQAAGKSMVHMTETCRPPDSVPVLFSDIDTPNANPTPTSQIIVRQRFVEVNFEVLGDPSDDVQATGCSSQAIGLNLFSDVNMTTVKDRIEVAASGTGFVWIGYVDGDEASQVILAVSDGILSGNIRLSDKFYQIRNTGGSAHVIREIDSSRLPPDGPTMLPPQLPVVDGPVEAPPPYPPDGPSRIPPQ